MFFEFHQIVFIKSVLSIYVNLGWYLIWNYF
jgi:hypothetical protein